MDLISRLKFYMDHVGMPSSVFADTAQIPRPTLSQILSGRNKKISNEVIAKLHLAFPSLNIMWLMFGDGDMEVTPKNAFSEPQITSQASHSAPQSINNQRIVEALPFDRDDSPHTQSGETRQNVLAFTAENEGFTHDDAAQQPQPMRPTSPHATHTVQQSVKSSVRELRLTDATDTATTDKPADGASARKRIESIMVFYTDNSFEVFRPAD